MPVPFQVVALPLEPFVALFSLTDAQLRARGMCRMVADRTPGFPCRVSLQDADVGERVILLSHQHHDVDSPYRAAGPIFVRESARPAELPPNTLPAVVARRLVSLRAYDARATMVDAAVVHGSDAQAALEDLFTNAAVRYVHVHNAKPGCFSCEVQRVEG